MTIDDPTLWYLLMTHRPPEVWGALFGGILFAFNKSVSSTNLGRCVEAGISGLIGYSMGMDAADYSRVSPEVATFLITAVGYVVVDGLRALVMDRAVLKDMILRLIGGHNNGK